MSTLELLVGLTEKMALLAAAAVFAVLFPPLRKRLLGQAGESRDRAFGMLFGTGLSVWGSNLGLDVGGEHINVRAIGVIVAAILGGRKAGALAGLCIGIFMASRVDNQTAPWVLLASLTDGIVAAVVIKRSPNAFRGHRAFFTAIGVQVFHLAIVGFGLMLVGHAGRYLPAWPAHLVKLLVNAAGVTLFVEVSRLVVQREEAALALIKAKAAADQMALESLRRRLEPHFLFNSLNVLRATIRIDPKRARELVSNLADLYRYLLSHPEDAPLRDEINHARAYLDIESARLGDGRLKVEVDLPTELAELRVPALLLQPLVENAVKHGIGNRTGHGTVFIRARFDASLVRAGTALFEPPDAQPDLLIEIEDHSEGPRRTSITLSGLRAEDEDARPGAGIALKTLRQRLAHLHGRRAELLLSPTEHGMIASVRLPVGNAGAAEDDGESSAAHGATQRRGAPNKHEAAQ
jgi:LytS/YehU family sensor histidine kinase